MSVNVRFTLVLGVGLLCQAVVVPFMSIGNAKPDIILIIIASFGFLEGPAPGAIGGFAGGLIQDLLAFRAIGLGALVKTTVGYFSGQVERNILGNAAIMPMLAIGGVSLVSQILYIGLAFLAGEPMGFFMTLRTVAIPSAAYTAAIGFFIFPYLNRLLQQTKRQDKAFK